MSFKIILSISKTLSLATVFTAASFGSSPWSVYIADLTVRQAQNTTYRSHSTCLESNHSLACSQLQNLSSILQNHFSGRRISIRHNYNTNSNSIIVDGISPDEFNRFRSELLTNPVLNTHINYSNNKFNEIDSEISSLENQIAGICSTSDDFVEEVDNKISSINSTIDQHQTSINQTQADVTTLQNQVTQLSQQNSQLTRLVQQQQSEIEHLKKTVSENLLVFGELIKYLQNK